MQFSNNTMAYCTSKNCTRSVACNRINQRHTISPLSLNHIASTWKSSICHLSWATRVTRRRPHSAAERVAATEVSTFRRVKKKLEEREEEKIKRRDEIFCTHETSVVQHRVSHVFRAEELTSRSCSCCVESSKNFSTCQRVKDIATLSDEFSASATRNDNKTRIKSAQIDIAQHRLE